MRRSLVAGALALVSAGACTHSLHQYQVSDSGASGHTGGKRDGIKAESDQFVILGMTGNTDYVNKAFERLRSQCPDGEVINIHTRYSTSLGFLSYTNKIHLQATCVKGS